MASLPFAGNHLDGRRSGLGLNVAFELAYNLGNLWRRLVVPLRVGNWSLTDLQQRLVKTGDRLITHTRYYWLRWRRAI